VRPIRPVLERARASWRPGLSLFAVHFALRGQLEYATASSPVRSVAGGLGSARGLLAQYAAFDRGEWFGDDPWLLLVCPTSVDPARAPDGHGIAKFLTIAPYRLSGGRNWSTERDCFSRALTERAARFVDGLADTDVLATVAESPVDLELRNRHNVGGSCHGGEVIAADGEILAGWPGYRLPLPGLYQTGSTAHPGGSVSGRAGRNAARTMLTDFGVDPRTVMGED
jgi:phytoene dehydrogenase-like protein